MLQTVNKSINFQSDRGNDIYRENEVVRIKLDPGSAPLINTQDSYLMFSLKMDDANARYCIPDPALGGVPFEQITIMDGNETTLLEQMDNVGLWTSMKNYYGNNVNDEHLQKIYEGRGGVNSQYIKQVNGVMPYTASNRNENVGGGFQSQYHQFPSTDANGVTAPTNSRKCQVLYRFPMSGLLSAMKSELLPIITMNGLVIKLTLMANAKFLRIQQVQARQVNRVGSYDIGYGEIDEQATPATQQFHAGVVNSPHNGGKLFTNYGLYGYLDNAGAEQVGAIPDNAGANITGIILQKTSDSAGPYVMGVDSLKNLSLKVGGYAGVGYSTTLGAGSESSRVVNGIVGVGAVTANEKIASITMDANGRAVVRFTGAILPNQGAGGASNEIVCVGGPICAWIGALPDGQATEGYAVSDIQMVCNVVEAPAGYMETMVNQASSGQLKIQYNSYRDERVNITTGSISNEIFIPCDLQRCYCILAVNEILRGHSIYRSDFTPTNTNLFNYQWILNGTNTPNIPVSLTKLANNQVSPLQIIELEKALDESSIRIRNIQNPHNFTVIGRRLGAYGDSVSLLDKTVKCRINYSPTQTQNLLYHFYIYHTKTLMFEGGGRVVLE
jgi:hypothetical protein